ncbi:MAG TPA: hypothetical protein VD861_20335 [Pyrinomonadaceae bacterium]|nr:hypothetical protein [Pyrinomonadaceae bacterium]
MATISNQSLTIQNVNATTVSVTVRYSLTPNGDEKLLGSGFRENIQLIGDDPGTANDVVIFNFPEQGYSVNNTTTSVNRSRTRTILKSSLNEDSGFATTGAELSDEILARINITYIGNDPTPPALPQPTATNTVSGAWK